MSIEIKHSKRRISYQNAMKFLNRRVAQIRENKKPELLWILEHPTTFTAGIRHNKNEILDHSIKVIKTNRGGKITLHAPGQKIVYLVINLNKRKKDIRRLVTIIENSIIEFLQIYKIFGKPDRKNIGIWVNGKKIAAIGLKISKWIAFHGCSINVKNDLDQYLKIVPCGLDNKKVTSMLNEKKSNIINIENNLTKIFIKNLNKI